MVDITEEQKQFLEECEEEFKDRYTSNDEEFMKINNTEPKDPPIIDPWHNKPRRNAFEWSTQNNESHSHRRYDNWERHHRHQTSQRNVRPY